MHHTDPALDTLFLPFTEARLTLPDEVLFLRARDGAALRRHRIPTLICEQSFKPDAEALQRAGFSVTPLVDSRQYPLAMVLPPRQRDETRALLARAVASVQPGGVVMASASNDEGARSIEADLKQLTGAINTMSKSKCRVFWSEPLNAERINQSVLAQWRELDAPRSIANDRFISRPGVFAWDRIDNASTLLAAHLPSDLTGRAGDLGVGYGYLSAELLTRCPRINALDCYEAEQRALDLARQNLSAFEARVPIRHLWHDVTTGLPHQYDVIVTNPPFHTQSRTDRPDIGRRFIAVAATALKPGGSLWLVANRHLPYESILDASFGSTRIVTQDQGFKIIEAIKTKTSTPERRKQ